MDPRDTVLMGPRDTVLKDPRAYNDPIARTMTL
jgi:hypothetical protein